ncbi:MAG: short chain dehydrogenase [Bacteroidetes bacterium]|nr:MAG: short chain dehydrogenase [Bacteroidota bacterium]
MKILIIGGNGTIGHKVRAYFAAKHQTISVGRNSGELNADIADSQSIHEMFEASGKVDAIINIAGEAKWAPFGELSEEDYYLGIRSKLMGQVNLSRIGINYLNPGGSITLTTGILADDPVPMSTSSAMVNGAIHSFVKAAALEMDNGRRINAVSAGLVEDSVDKYQAFFPGHIPIPMKKVIFGYARSVEGRGNGEIIRIYN